MVVLYHNHCIVSFILSKLKMSDADTRQSLREPLSMGASFNVDLAIFSCFWNLEMVVFAERRKPE